MRTADAAQIAIAGFTALAAFAAWAAVGQVVRERRAAQVPALHIEVIGRIPSGEIEVSLVNDGGPAKRVTFVVIEGPGALIGHPPPSAYMRPGESRLIKTSLHSSGSHRAIGAVIAVDLANRYVYGTPISGETRRWRLTDEISDSWVFHQLYPDAPDPTTLALGTYELVDRSR